MLYLITNRKLVKHNNFFNIIEEAVKGGIYAVILREKDLSTEELLTMAIIIKGIIGTRNVKLIINSNLEAANTVGAYGFHSSYKNFIAASALFNGKLGVSIHSIEEAIEAEKHGAHYLLFGHVFETECKKGLPPSGIENIKVIKDQVNIPVIALGGIKPENIHEVMEAGADGAAVMSTIMECDNPYLLVKNYINKMQKDRVQSPCKCI